MGFEFWVLGFEFSTGGNFMQPAYFENGHSFFDKVFYSCFLNSQRNNAFVLISNLTLACCIVDFFVNLFQAYTVLRLEVKFGF